MILIILYVMLSLMLNVNGADSDHHSVQFFAISNFSKYNKLGLIHKQYIPKRCQTKAVSLCHINSLYNQNQIEQTRNSTKMANNPTMHAFVHNIFITSSINEVVEFLRLSSKTGICQS